MAFSASQNDIPSREDTSICGHLSSLLGTSGSSSSNEGAPSGSRSEKGASDNIETTVVSVEVLNEVERKFVEVVKWGAIREGAKRRKVGTES